MRKESPIIVREARPEDAAALVDFVTRLSEERELYLLLEPGEFTMMVEEEAELLSKYAQLDNWAYFVAEAGGQIVGGLNLKGGTRAGNRHCAVLGISVGKGWRGKGVGSQLMAHALQWARQGGMLKRIELFVFVENEPAIRLYEKFDFMIEGRLRKAVFRHERFYDDYLMALLL